MKNELIELIKIENISPNPNQPRKSFDDEKLCELSNSIKEQGIIQPLIVEKTDKNSYMIIAGERRYRAAKEAGLTEIPVIVKTFNTLQKMQIAIIENVQRENLNPIEEAYAYIYLLQEGGMTQEEVAKKIGKSRSAIANSVRLINLPQKMINSILKNEMTSGHARAILSVTNPADREILFTAITEKNLNVRDSENYAAMLNNGARMAGNFIINNSTASVSANKNIFGRKDKKLSDLEEMDKIKKISKSLSRTLKTKIRLKGNLSCGKIVINYISFDDLERLYRIFGGQDSLIEDEEEL